MDAVKLRILFIDDSSEDVELELWALRKAGIAVRPQRVQTEEALLDALLHFQPDLILSDLRLPLLDGPTALRLVKANRAETPFLFVSGSVDKVEVAADLPFIFKNRLDELPGAVLRALGKAPE